MVCKGEKIKKKFAIDDDLITWIIGCECWYYYDHNNQQISVFVTLHLLFPCQNRYLYDFTVLELGNGDSRNNNFIFYFN